MRQVRTITSDRADRPRAIVKGDAPDLLGSETGHKLGYASLCVLGQQRLVGAKKRDFSDTLRLLHEFGGAAVFRHADLIGQTALSFAIHDGAERPCVAGGRDQADSRRQQIDLLIKLGCDVNARIKVRTSF